MSTVQDLALRYVDARAINTIRESDSLREDLGLEDMDVIELIMAIEEEFGFATMLDDDSGASMLTIQDLVDYVKKKCG